MKRTKDPTLEALKRSARAILKDELKALRKAANERLAAVERLQDELDQARRDTATHAVYSSQVRSRAQRAADWARKHAVPQGNTAALALAEWVLQGDTPNSGAGFGQLHPFDRWQVTPKP